MLFVGDRKDRLAVEDELPLLLVAQDKQQAVDLESRIAQRNRLPRFFFVLADLSRKFGELSLDEPVHVLVGLQFVVANEEREVHRARFGGEDVHGAIGKTFGDGDAAFIELIDAHWNGRLSYRLRANRAIRRIVSSSG